MPSTVYKGDLTEVSFGHETGLTIPHGVAGNVKFIAKSGERDLTADTSIIKFEGGSSTAPVTNAGGGSRLNYPLGMLVGATVTFEIGSTSPNFSTDDSVSVSGRTFKVVAHNVVSSVTELTITPALTTDHSGGDKESKTDDVMTIHSFGVPTIDIDTVYHANAVSSSESVLTDQFLGLAATVTLPETKVDLKRYHVVGLGRDVAIQVPGRFINQGGSFEVNMHNARWLYYCLGMEAVDIASSGAPYQNNLDANDVVINGAIEAGANSLVYGGTDPDFAGVSSPVAAGDYIIIEDANTADIVTYKEADGETFGATATPRATYFDKTEKSEIRRISCIDTSTNRIWFDDPLCFSHANGENLHFVRFAAGSSSGSIAGIPDRASTGALTNGVTRLLYSRSHIPSFAMEVSVRRRDVDGNAADVVDGGATDSKQLTRVFRGCKVKDFSLTTDTDAALRLSVNFDSALCYTDTGRLESSNKGDRYNAHRMFEDTANTDTKRKESGIAVGTQKPFMFYNGSVTLAGVNVAQVVSFTLSGSTGVQQYYTINGSPVVDAETDQVPHAGSRNPSLAVEGKTEYSLDMEIIVDDPIFYHKMRRAVDFDATTDNMIRLSFTKAGSGSNRESIDILLDDYVITEAPLPIPEDKGPMRASLKVAPKAMRVIATDTLLHS